MLETAVNNGLAQLGLEEEIAKAGTVDGDIGALDVLLVLLLGLLLLWLLLLVVVEKILIVDISVSHFSVVRVSEKGEKLAKIAQISNKGHYKGLRALKIVARKQ